MSDAATGANSAILEYVPFGQPIAPNLRLGRPAPNQTDEVWVADTPYGPTAEDWLFVAAVRDLSSRQIPRGSVWESLAATGALQALVRALVKRGHPTGVIHHSDRGIHSSLGWPSPVNFGQQNNQKGNTPGTVALGRRRNSPVPCLACPQVLEEVGTGPGLSL